MGIDKVLKNIESNRFRPNKMKANDLFQLKTTNTCFGSIDETNFTVCVNLFEYEKKQVLS